MTIFLHFFREWGPRHGSVRDYFSTNQQNRLIGGRFQITDNPICNGCTYDFAGFGAGDQGSITGAGQETQFDEDDRNIRENRTPQRAALTAPDIGVVIGFNTPVPQEIACHTLTHAFVDPRPAGREALRDELRRFLELFRELGWERPRSFIFPNRFARLPT